MAYENIVVEGDARISRIVISREKALNALNEKTLRELSDAVDGLPSTTRVLVITGQGEKSFIAGADISEMVELSVADAVRFSKLGHDLLAKLENAEFVVIAEVNGYALGGGCELMLACDFAVASDNARLGQPEVALGVTPGFGGTTRLGRKVGDAWARRLLVTGEQLKADEALRIGLVTEVVPKAELRGRVDALANTIAEKAPIAVSLAKRAQRLSGDVDLGSANAFEQQVFGLCFSTSDQREGMRAFVEKRKPEWQGE